MSFLGQISLEEAAKAGDTGFLPRAGRLLFFFDPEQSVWGNEPTDRDAWKVIYAEDQTSEPELELPDQLPTEGTFNRCDMRFEARLSYPSRDRATNAFPNEEIDVAYEAAIASLTAERQTWRHTLLGWPEPIQSDEMELQSQFGFWKLRGMRGTTEHDWVRPGADKWQLLVQIDSDDDVGMMWGDVGRLFFFVRRHDAERCDFSNVWMVLQCY
jgi:uncharacterized protein YwqG